MRGSFDLTLNPDPVVDEEGTHYSGRIVLGEFTEAFEADGFAWSPARVSDGFVVQNRLMLREMLQSVFDPDHAERFIEERRSASDDDAPVAEWKLTPDCFEGFAR